MDRTEEYSNGTEKYTIGIQQQITGSGKMISAPEDSTVKLT